jgi:NitT/TauT family transport system permease protein
VKRIIPPLLAFVIVVLAWWAYVYFGHIAIYLLPPPQAVLRSLIVDREDLLLSLEWTALAAGAGFLGGAALGISIGVLLSMSAVLRRAIYPYTIFFQTVPIIAIAPMLLFWIGVGISSVIVCAIVVCVFPVIANTLAGMRSTDPALEDLFTLYGAGPIERMWKLRLPSALPAIFTGLRIAAGLAVIGTVVAEFVVGEIIGPVGLGVRIVGDAKKAKTDHAFACIILASALGLALLGVVNLASHIALRRWHASEG